MSTAAKRRTAMAQARTYINAGKLTAIAARRSRERAEQLAADEGFYVGADEVGDEQCHEIVVDGTEIRCLRPAGHEGACL